MADPLIKDLAYQALAYSLTTPEVSVTAKRPTQAEIDAFEREQLGLPSPIDAFTQAASMGQARPVQTTERMGRERMPGDATGGFGIEFTAQAPTQATISEYNPTIREILSARAQSGLESLGLRRQQARNVSQNIIGGASSSLPFGIGIADFLPFIGTTMQTEEAALQLERAKQSAEQGQIGQAAIETGLGLFGLIPGAAGTIQAAKPIGKEIARRFGIDGNIIDGQIQSGQKIGAIDEARMLSKPDSEVLYETGTEGPFLTIINRGAQPSQKTSGEFRLYGGTAIEARDPGRRSALYSDSQRQPDEEVQLRLAPENNAALKVAQQITRKNLNADYNPEFKIEPSSLKKQSAIGISYELAANKLPGYKGAVFNAYKNDPEYGPLMQELGIKNYDDLVKASYQQLEKETIDQFRSLPVKMSFHKQGEGDYLDSGEMVKDAHLHNHLFVFQGGDPHEFLGKVDETTGLSANDMFRAVHDYFGHAIKGNSFGPKGEEIAWASHAQMYSPLARIAMTAETRGQNSFVNYTQVNAKLTEEMESLRKTEFDLRSAGKQEEADEIKNEIGELGKNWQYAKQASVALPPEMTKLDYAGGMPEYVRSIQAPGGEMMLGEHYSRVGQIKKTDPSKQGTAAAGREKERLQQPGAQRGRTYFYAEGREPESVVRSIAPYKYKSLVSSLYNADKDPLELKKLAKVKNTESYLSKINKGTFDAASATNDFERMIYERGYSGFVTGEGKNRIAVSFEPVELKKE